MRFPPRLNVYWLGFNTALITFAFGMWIIRPDIIEGAKPAQAAAIGGGFSCTVSRIIDGDTFDCIGGPRVRVAAINARERDGSCRRNAPCQAASNAQAEAVLSNLIAGQVLQCEPNGTTGNRIAAFCRTSAGVDLSCSMMSSGTVAKWNRHWRGHRC